MLRGLPLMALVTAAACTAGASAPAYAEEWQQYVHTDRAALTMFAHRSV